MSRIDPTDVQAAATHPTQADEFVARTLPVGSPLRVLRGLTDNYALQVNDALIRAGRERDANLLEAVGSMILLLAQTEREYAELSADRQ